MKKITALVMAVVIFLGLFTGYKVVYAAASDLSDYEKEILNAYLLTIDRDSEKWINIYSYDDVKYDFRNCKEEILSFDYSWDVLTSPDESIAKSFVYTSFKKGYDALKKMDYLVTDGLLIVQDYRKGNRLEFENVHQAKQGKDDWGWASIAGIIIYRVTLGVYIKEVDGKLYAYGEKYKFKDITEKNIVTPEELTEEEYINFATWVADVYYSSSFKMEDMYGLENPPLRKFIYWDLYYIPITKGSMSVRRYLPVEYLDDNWWVKTRW
jgi:hypothetical protein